MARNDGIDRTVARNQDLETPADVAKVQEHNEREKDSYSNQDIVPERTALNVHFKSPTDDYVKMFEQMEQDGVISTRGLKPDAVKYGELIFDVNSAYFYNHGGYEFAKQFYADAYKAAVEIVGGEQYILSAVMHADERNRAMSEALGEDVPLPPPWSISRWWKSRSFGRSDARMKPSGEPSGGHHTGQPQQEMGVKPVLGERKSMLNAKKEKDFEVILQCVAG